MRSTSVTLNCMARLSAPLYVPPWIQLNVEPAFVVAVKVALMLISTLYCMKKALAVQNLPAGQARANVAARVVVDPTISASFCFFFGLVSETCIYSLQIEPIIEFCVGQDSRSTSRVAS